MTYVRVNSSWSYVCVQLDLHAREIIGFSCGPKKTAQLVYEAFASVKQPLNRIEFLQTDRGSDLKEQLSITIQWFNQYQIHSLLGYLSLFNIKKN